MWVEQQSPTFTSKCQRSVNGVLALSAAFRVVSHLCSGVLFLLWLVKEPVRVALLLAILALTDGPFAP